MEAQDADGKVFVMSDARRKDVKEEEEIVIQAQ